MGLSIFSFDLAAIINSLSNINEAIADTSDINLQSEPNSLPTAEMVASAGETSTTAIVEEILLASSVSTLSAVSPDELIKKETIDTQNVLPKPTMKSKTLPPEVQAAIDQLIKSLQTSVAFAYQGTDLSNQKFSQNNLLSVSQRQALNNLEKKSNLSEDEKKRRDAKTKELETQLKRAIILSNANRKYI